ncbi:PREDICTED: pathogenesis-related protein 5-like [Nelumbo nucifera]|uniref:Pathogenesis-related protein 5-like n=2 Tax=Nelumbo nucifera TaxID=4432 RepID=A0A822YUS6_NELNU|nr:PREDICTED: pathogenesis-related protein 5-like [Nelumbo nucifera]DAD33985.1 TPA_asm: hypothetical protein HUJ06_004625 [Nelumbo nucifera]DAD36432.1 TPA_asm: hypothetical protein HUJ06_007073 [Nelumbo nucifera]
MASWQKVSSVLLTLSFFFFFGSRASATVFTFKNQCSYTVWPGTLANNGGPVLGDGGFLLAPGATSQVTAPPGWEGRFWARTGCNFDGSGNGRCTTGDCGGLKCRGAGVPPVTLAEFKTGTNNDMEYYDISLVDGYNVNMGIKPTGGTGDCKDIQCVADINGSCPAVLQLKDSAGNVVACKSACTAFNTPEYCCTGNHNTPQTCSPSQYSQMFKRACPMAYSYAYDDPTSTFTCAGSDYLITFCP